MTLSEKQPFWEKPIAFVRPRRWTITVSLSSVFALLIIYGIMKRGAASPAHRLWRHLIPQPPTTYLRDATRPGAMIHDPSRATDLTDTFTNFTRKPWCTLSSLDLHTPFHPLCSSRNALLTSLTSGGRPGLDAPYVPRDCDMRWYSVPEICHILSKFEQVNVIGDSMMRNLAVAMHVFLRMDLEDGGRTGWKEDPPGVDCRCGNGFATGKCIFNSAFSSLMVWREDANSMACPRLETALVEFTPLLKYPLKDAVELLRERLPTTRPKKPHAFILGHGIWNELDEAATRGWTYEVERAIAQRMPYLFRHPQHERRDSGLDSFHQFDIPPLPHADNAPLPQPPPEPRVLPNAIFPRLFVTPSAAGINKPVVHAEKQGNAALSRFEGTVGAWAEERGYDHLGTYNLTLQGSSPDGTHAGMSANLIKAMMVFNWLDWVGVEGW